MGMLIEFKLLCGISKIADTYVASAKIPASLNPLKPTIKKVSLVRASKLKNCPAKTNKAKLIILPFSLLVTELRVKLLKEKPFD